MPPARSILAAFGVVSALAAPFFPRSAIAQVAEPGPHSEEQLDFMHLLARHGLHRLEDEAWNVYGQATYISSWKLPFPAPYTNLNGSPSSLLPTAERGWTGTFTLFFGLRLWPGGEAYYVPEVIAELPLSGLHGLGGAIQNFELQKNGLTTPEVYRARAYLQHTFELGGGKEYQDSDPMQLGKQVDKRRVILRAGNFSVIDFFDKNTFAGDLRQQFFNMAFLTYAAYDFVADARGYSFGGMIEAYWDDWAFRIGRLAGPLHPNVLPIDLRLDQLYGDQIELEHSFQILGKAGAARLLGYRNRAVTGRFSDAIAAFEADRAKNAAACTDYNYGSMNAGAPDLCWVRKPNVKIGIGLNLEQHLTDDVGLFFRGMVSDGQTEVYAYTSADRSIAFGALAKGSAWHRPLDVAGVGAALGWISTPHAEYLKLGGVDGFVGDGTIRQAAESVLEVFYSVSVLDALWLSADYQHIANPAFNADRGPVDVFGARFHAEY